MTEQPYLPGMNDAESHTVMAAQDAAEGLLALGWPVRPARDDLEAWMIGDFELTDEELIGLATRRGIRPAVEQVQ